MKMLNPMWIADNALSLDIAYGARSADKFVSTIVNHDIDDDVGVVSDDDLTLLVTACYSMFNENWEALWKAVNVEYEPLENYNRNSTITTKTNEKNTGSLTNQRELTDTGTVDKSLTDTGTLSNDSTVANSTTNNTYGFDSNNAVPSSSSTQTNTTNSTETHDLSNTINEVRNLANSENLTETRNLENTNETTHTEIVKGNIGVTTSQQMLQSEYDLRRLNNFYEAVFGDVDNFFTLPIY